MKHNTIYLTLLLLFAGSSVSAQTATTQDSLMGTWELRQRYPNEKGMEITYTYNETEETCTLRTKEGKAKTKSYYYLSETVPDAFDYAQVGKNKTGKYLITLSGKGRKAQFTPFDIFEIVTLSDTHMQLKQHRSSTLFEYDKVAAEVIAMDDENWFSTFTINRGTDDGIQVDCNVIAGSGLVGIVTDVGSNWATVRSIIDDSSNVSAMTMSTSDRCIVSGDLRLINEGKLQFIHLKDDDDRIQEGEKIVTSDVSEKFLPGILIGYVSEIEEDPNNLTKTGTLTPVVDFEHIREVLVIKELKQQKGDS